MRIDTPSLSTPQHIALGLYALVAVAVAYTLYFASDLLIPLAIAGLLSIVLSPLVRWFVRHRIPRSVAAGLLLATIIAVLAAAVGTLSGPAQEWLEEAPKTVRGLQKQIVPAKSPIEDIKELADEVDELASVKGKRRTQAVVVETPGILHDFVGGLPVIVAGTVVVTFLTYFLLLSGDNLLRQVTMCGRNWTERRRIVTIARRIERDVSVYLRTVTLINCGLGATVACVLFALDIPNPVLWGVVVAIFNFAPYVGALASFALLAVVGLTNAETIAAGIMAPAMFLLLTILEGQLLTPTVLGRRMALNPMMVFVAVIVWGWLWGIAGALMAVPIVTSIKVVCDNVPALRCVSMLLRDGGPDPTQIEAFPATRKERLIIPG